MSNNKKGMYNIRHPADQYMQIGDSRLIRVEAIGDINLVFHQLDEHGNPEDVVARVQDVIYTPWLGFNLFSIWKVGHKINCSVNPTGTQAGKLRFIRGSANDSLYATRLPPPTPVNVARESPPVPAACNPPVFVTCNNPPMQVAVSRESAPVSSNCYPPMPVAVSRENAPVSSTCYPPMPVGVSRESCLLYTSPSPRD